MTSMCAFQQIDLMTKHSDYQLLFDVKQAHLSVDMNTIIYNQRGSVHLWGMESIVDGVEDEGETEGSPANPQCNEKIGGFEVMSQAVGVNHSDGLSTPHQ